jgi:hypothetical protein
VDDVGRMESFESAKGLVDEVLKKKKEEKKGQMRSGSSKRVKRERKNEPESGRRTGLVYG